MSTGREVLGAQEFLAGCAGTIDRVTGPVQSYHGRAHSDLCLFRNVGLHPKRLLLACRAGRVGAVAATHVGDIRAGVELRSDAFQWRDPTRWAGTRGSRCGRTIPSR
jgi:hypothetical protein